MHPFRSLADPAVDKLRWLMLATMLVCVILTLAGQPSAFWIHPDSAIRADGLGIHDPTNHSFDFFLGCGWLAYLACSTTLISALFLLVSVLPRWFALVLLLTVTLGDVYVGTNWLAVRWHESTMASVDYGLGVGFPLAYVVASTGRSSPDINRRFRWIPVAAVLVDMSFTLAGQPAGYWAHPEMAYEGNIVSRYMLVHGWVAFLAYDVVYALTLLLAVTALPRITSLAVAFFFLIAHFGGASNWLFFVWRQGIGSVIAYACLLSAAVVFLAFERQGLHTTPTNPQLTPR